MNFSAYGGIHLQKYVDIAYEIWYYCINTIIQKREGVLSWLGNLTAPKRYLYK